MEQLTMNQDTTFTDQEAEQVLSGICIPPCPAILTKLIQALRGDEPNFGKISQLISEDASLSAAMLQTVNSAFYGLRVKATTVQQAIILLGLREVRRLATRILLRDAFSNCNMERMEKYWEYSSAIAQLSSVLAERFGGGVRDEVYTFALFRDCGMLAMMDSYENYTPVLPGEAPAGGDVIALENMLHNMNHARVGANLAKIWLLPEEIYEPILWHHDYLSSAQARAKLNPAHARHIALALVAEWIYVKHTTGSDSPDWHDGHVHVLKDLNTTLEDLEAVMAQITETSGIF
jgi:HD-like signal output (HDOD) protein